MDNTFNSLDQTFDIAPEVEVTPVRLSKSEKKAMKLDNISDMKEKDLSFVRGKLLQMTERLSEAAEESLEVALESSHPRAFEVSSNAMKLCAEVAEKLTDLHNRKEVMESRKEQQPAVAGTQVQNNMFVGSTSELMKLLKDNK